MSAISDKFQRSRWSLERRQLDAMHPGDTLSFGLRQYNNVKSGVERLNDAYDGERPRWIVRKHNGAINVTHEFIVAQNRHES